LISNKLSRINLCISLVYFLSSLLKMHGPKNKIVMEINYDNI